MKFIILLFIVFLRWRSSESTTIALSDIIKEYEEKTNTLDDNIDYENVIPAPGPIALTNWKSLKDEVNKRKTENEGGDLEKILELYRISTIKRILMDILKNEPMDKLKKEPMDKLKNEPQKKPKKNLRKEKEHNIKRVFTEHGEIFSDTYEIRKKVYGKSESSPIIGTFFNTNGAIQYYSGRFVFQNLGTISYDSDIDLSIGFEVDNICIKTEKKPNGSFKTNKNIRKTLLEKLKQNVTPSKNEIKDCEEKSKVFFDIHTSIIFIQKFHSYFSQLKKTSDESLDMNIYLRSSSKEKMDYYLRLKKNKSEYNGYENTLNFKDYHIFYSRKRSS